MPRLVSVEEHPPECDIIDKLLSLNLHNIPLQHYHLQAPYFFPDCREEMTGFVNILLCVYTYISIHRHTYIYIVCSFQLKE